MEQDGKGARELKNSSPGMLTGRWIFLLEIRISLIHKRLGENRSLIFSQNKIDFKFGSLFLFNSHSKWHNFRQNQS